MTARVIRIAGVVTVSAFALAVTILLFTLQSRWFETKLESRVVAVIESTTGTRVSVDSVRLHFRIGSIDLNNVVLHGTEPAGASPLFQAPSIRLGIKLSTLFLPKLDLASITIHNPQVSVTVAPDGSTNFPSLPARRHNIYEQLMNLGVDRFELDHASLCLNDQSIRFDAKGSGLKVVWTRRSSADPSRLSVVSNGITVQYGGASPASFDLRFAAELMRDRVQVKEVMLKTGSSSLDAAGFIWHLAKPDARFQIRAQAAVQDLARFTALPHVPAGNLAFSGNAAYAPMAGLTANGKLHVDNLAYAARRVTVRNITGESDVSASQSSGIRFDNLVLTSSLAKLKGNAAVTLDRKFSLAAAVNGVQIQKFASAAGVSSPWSGIASGSLSATGKLSDKGVADLSASTDATIMPSTGGIPISGKLRAALNGVGHISFGASNVVLPGTRIAFSGVPDSNLHIAITSTRLEDLKPVFSLAGFHHGADTISLLGPEASGSFTGSIAGPLTNPIVQGTIAMQHVHWMGKNWNRVQSDLVFSENGLSCESLTVDDDAMHAQAKGRLALTNWNIQPGGAFQLNARLQGLDVNRISIFQRALGSAVTSGTASALFNLTGTLQAPVGTAQISAANLLAYGQRIETMRANATIAGDSVRFDRGRLQSGSANIAFSGTYEHPKDTWTQGQLALRVDSNQFPLLGIAPVSKRLPDINAEVEAHGDVKIMLTPASIRPVRADGTVLLRGISFSGKRLGTVLIKSETNEKEMTATLSGDLQETALRGSASVQLTTELPLRADAQFGKLDIRALSSLLGIKPEFRDVMTGFMDGTVSVSGPLDNPRQWRSKLQLASLQMMPDSAALPGSASRLSDLVFQNDGPLVIEASGGTATVQTFHLKGKDTSLSATGSFDVLNTRPADLKLNGTLNLRALGLLDSKLDASGESDLSAAISGSLADPAIKGTLRINSGSFFFQDVTNGLSSVNGTILFNRERATIQTLTAQSGGGTLRLGGFVSFGAPGTLIYGLNARAEKVRLRYGAGISVTTDADLQLSGSSSTSLLSGNATVSRVVLNPNTDIGTVFASFAAPAPAPANQKDFVTGLHFDISLESTPNLELNTALSRNLQAAIDLRLRGTPDHPILLGTVTANQGDIKVFGARYSINRGEVTFVNAVKIEPVLDVDLETETKGITVDITIAGTLNRLNITYRSDPPLQPRDIIALLAIGRSPTDTTSQQSAQVSSEASQLQSGAYSALNQAVSPNQSRLSKLFGVTNIKIDPLVEGIAYNTARLTLEEQLSRDVTVTYVTNLAQTGEQVFRVEWALNRQFSVVAVRDDNGMFGLDFLIKRSFK